MLSRDSSTDVAASVLHRWNSVRRFQHLNLGDGGAEASGLSRLCVIFALLIGIVAACTSNVAAQAKQAKEIEEHIRKGLDFYETGKYDKALAELQTALALKPDGELVYRLMEKIGTDKMVKLVGEEKFTDVAYEFLSLVKEATIRKRTDPKVIVKLRNQLINKDFQARWEAMAQLVQIGEYAVPYILHYLDDDYMEQLERDKKIIHEERVTARTAAQLCLVKMGNSATLPLIEALNAKNLFLRQNVVSILGDIGDIRAIPALKAIVDNPDEKPALKEFAASALVKITGKDISQLKAAEEYYYDLAEKYYYEDIHVIRVTYDPEVIIWKWKESDSPKYEDKIFYITVPRYAYNDQMAEEVCHDGLAVNPNYEPLLGLLTAVYYTQLNEVEGMLKSNKASGGKELNEDQLKEVTARRNRLTAIRLMTESAGRKYLYMALERAIKDENAPLALSCIESLRAVSDDVDPEEDNPLVHALSFPDKMVRYAAAEALIHISPEGSLGGVEEAMKVMAYALSEKERKAILIIDNNLETINRFKEMIHAMNYVTLEATDALVGLRRAKESYPRVDLILLASDLTDEDSAAILIRLKNDRLSGNIPVIVTAPEASVKDVRRKMGTKADAVLAKNINKAGLAQALTPLLQQTKVADEKAVAEEVIKKAADAIAAINPNNTRYPLSRVVKPLTKLLKGHKDEIRKPALVALGNIGDRSAMPAVMATFTEKGNTPMIRLTALRAVGKIILASKRITPDEYQILTNALNEKDGNIRAEAARSLGKAALLAGKAVAIFREHRIAD